jgi:tryptophanyl-tRNA synthetase
MHIAQGIYKAINVNKLTNAGCVFIFWVADWFAMLNNKMGGDLERIKKVGQYFVEVWKAAGMDMNNVRFVWASDEINKRAPDYWMTVMNIARAFNITRIKRCVQITGRSEGDDQQAATVLYPCMQCADIFFLKVGGLANVSFIPCFRRIFASLALISVKSMHWLVSSWIVQRATTRLSLTSIGLEKLHTAKHASLLLFHTVSPITHSR